MSRSPRLLLLPALLFLAAGCAQTAPTASPTPFPTPLPTATSAPLPTPRPSASPTLPATMTQPVAVASETPTTKPNPYLASPVPPATLAQCPLHPEQMQFQAGLSLKPSEQEGWCEVILPLPYHATIGYGLRYPAGWTVAVVGAESMNLGFTLGPMEFQPHDVAILLTLSELPLERADEATYGFEQSPPAPFVAPDEIEVSRAIRTIGDKEVLMLRTTQEASTIQRYFLLHGGTLYNVELRAATAEVGDADMPLQATVETMIASMTFVD